MGDVPAGPAVYSMGSCTAAAKRFLSNVDAVVGVHACWPQELFYFATHEYNARAVLVADPAGGHARPNAYWYRYAEAVVAADAAHRGKIFDLLAGRRTPPVHVIPRGSEFPGLLRSLVETILQENL
jgi:hypothetical protein